MVEDREIRGQVIWDFSFGLGFEATTQKRGWPKNFNIELNKKRTNNNRPDSSVVEFLLWALWHSNCKRSPVRSRIRPFFVLFILFSSL